jgi:hypothetical protein
MMKVTFEIEFDAETPEEAVKLALKVLAVPDQLPLWFVVEDGGKQHVINGGIPQ